MWRLRDDGCSWYTAPVASAEGEASLGRQVSGAPRKDEITTSTAFPGACAVIPPRTNIFSVLLRLACIWEEAWLGSIYILDIGVVIGGLSRRTEREGQVVREVAES